MKKYIILIAIELILCVSFSNSAYCQITHGGNGEVPGDLVGYDASSGTAGPLSIKNDFTSCPTCNIDFFIQTINLMSLTPAGDLTLMSAGGSGVNLNAYKIGPDAVVWHGDDPTSIFLGANTGYIGTSSSPQNNTLVGNGAGGTITLSNPAPKNVFVGYQSGYSAAGMLRTALKQVRM